MPIGGALKLKGAALPTKDKKKKKKKRDREEYEKGDGGDHHHYHDHSESHEADAAAAAAAAAGEEECGKGEAATAASAPKDDGLTATQRRHLEKLREREKQLMKKVLSKTHRERIDEFNQYLSVLTEHNDIPRVSAAGNG